MELSVNSLGFLGCLKAKKYVSLIRRENLERAEVMSFGGACGGFGINF